VEPLPKWLEQGEALSVEVLARDRAPGTATVYRRSLDEAARRKRAIKGLALCWLLALVSLPILFFHFFLVPMFLIAGPVLYVLRMREEALVLGAVVPCPACGEPSRLGAQVEEWPLGLSCGPCGQQLELQQPESQTLGGGPHDPASSVPPRSSSRYAT
jgi:hypothetical protein